MTKIKKKKVLITGSTRGIGLQIAKLFYENHYDVIINGRYKKKLKEVKKLMPNCYSLIGDVTNYKDVKRMTKNIHKDIGDIDILICNVGSGKSSEPGKENIKEFRRMLDLNFFSAVNVIENLLPSLTKNKGAIICISSICGIESIPGAPITYSVSKSALNSFVKFMSKPLALKKIRINAIAPGNILFKGSTWEKKLIANKPRVMKLIKSEVALQQFGDAKDIANLTLFLSGSNSKFITGSVFVIDGGQTRSI